MSGTGIVSIDSALVRRKWMREGLVQAASQSFWAPYTGTSDTSIVMQVNNENSAEGHTVVFDFDGNLTGKAIKGKTTAFGKGEQKRKFSDKVTVERYRTPVDNGDKFDGVNIGDLSINEHADSRSKLGDLWIRFKDQAIFDAAQGNLFTQDTGQTQPSSHRIDLGDTFTFNQLVNISKVLKTSQGYVGGKAKVRRPLDPFIMTTANGAKKPMWLFVADTSMLNVLRQDTAGWQQIIKDGDVRGNDNRNVTGYVGSIGNLLIVEADQFFGATAGTKSGWGLDDSEIEIAGLRQYSGADPLTAPWTGQEGFDYDSAELHSRGLVLGAGAIQLAMGKQPDYRFQSSEDFGIKSESALEVWTEIRKTVLILESGKQYNQAKITDIDYGVVTVDLKVGS